MWYRIELGKEGEILSCAEVEACVLEGRNVRYVEADNRTDAVKLVQGWWRIVLKRRQYAADVKTGRRIPVPRLVPRPRFTRAQKASNDEERAASEARRLERNRKKGTVVRRLQTLKQALVAFDKFGPVAFRKWLVSEIQRVESSRA